jgi:pimeloyl-ACP methyl ester carboxylesterase
MRLKTRAVVVTSVLIGTGLTGVVGAPTAVAFEPALTFVTCPAEAQPRGVQCAELTVPLDWATPDDGRTTTIAIQVIRSPRKGAGGLTFNPGGPGISGIDLAPVLHALMPAELQRGFDFVSWDPRGIGRSGPQLRDCDPQPGPDLPATGPVDWEVTWSAFATALGEATAACFAKNVDAAPYLGTWQVVRDLEAMRTALGYKRWNYWGMSYGTRVGNTYAKTFPGSVRTMILDGSVPPQETMYTFGAQWPAATSLAVEVYASVAGRSQAAKLQRSFAALNDSVLETPDGDFTRWDVAQRIFAVIGQQAAYPLITGTVNALHAAMVTERTLESRVRAAELLGIFDPFLDLGVNPYALTFINCADLHDRPTAREAAGVAAEAARNYGPVFAVRSVAASLCLGLPADYSPPVPQDLGTVTLATPPVIINGTGDPATSWNWARTMANQYAGSVMITYNSSQHVSYLQTPSQCVNAPVTQYLLNRTLPRNNTFCAYAATPVPQ